MVLLTNGRILLAYGRPKELRNQPSGTVRLYGVESRDGGRTWGDERLLEHNPACQAGRPSFLRGRDGGLRMFYYCFESLGKTAAESRSHLWAVRSTDEGRTWTDRRVVFRGYTGATNGAIETRAGALVVPFSFMKDPMHFASTVSVSSDGRTWTPGTDIDFGVEGGLGDHAGALEPAVVERRDGSLWMLIRTTRGQFWESESRDGGIRWSRARATSIRAPSSPACLLRLKSGRLCLIWNNTRAGVDTLRHVTAARGELHAALSGDEGRSWTSPALVATAGEVSYPFAIEPSPGRLLIASGRLRAKSRDTDVVVFRTSESHVQGNQP